MTTAITSAVQTRWAIDSAHTNVEFSVRHLMIATVKGRFSDVRGHVVLDGEDLDTAAVEVTIGAASIDTRLAQRDEHLRSADFFDVERFPVLTFTSRTVEPEGDTLKVTGELTIRGITREIVLDVTPHGRQTDPWGQTRMGFDARGTIRRSDFGLTWNQTLETGGVLVGDDVKIAIDAELVAQS